MLHVHLLMVLKGTVQVVKSATQMVFVPRNARLPMVLKATVQVMKSATPMEFVRLDVQLWVAVWSFLKAIVRVVKYATSPRVFVVIF